LKVYSAGHSKYSTEYHITWITKYRHPVLTLAVREYLYELLPKILETMPGCGIVTSNILKDHIHMVMIIPPKYAVKDVIGRLKGITSSKLRKRYSSLKAIYWADNVVWAPGYFVSTVGVAEDKIIEYVQNQ